MAGIYIHIPFCHKACHYCDFHFSTQLHYKERMVRAILKELELRVGEARGSISTLYFGGGTPSVLSPEELRTLTEKVFSLYEAEDDCEITLEANPEDLTTTKLMALKETGINRLSIGIQTFDDRRLKSLNRNHTAEEAIASVRNAKQLGFDNLTIDLIFALPNESPEYFRQDLETAISLEIPHLSVYGLTIEEGTVFGNWVKRGKLSPVSEETNLQQYLQSEETLTNAGFEHYEVSSYAKKGFYSKHNTSYWLQEPYLGFGPGAHSYDGESRKINLPHNHRYMEAIEEQKLPQEIEHLSPLDLANEYILTRSRTVFGLDFSYLKEKFDVDLLVDKGDIISELIKEGYLSLDGNVMKLSSKGWTMADEIALKLFYES